MCIKKWLGLITRNPNSTILLKLLRERCQLQILEHHAIGLRKTNGELHITKYHLLPHQETSSSKSQVCLQDIKDLFQVTMLMHSLEQQSLDQVDSTFISRTNSNKLNHTTSQKDSLKTKNFSIRKLLTSVQSSVAQIT